VHHLPVVLVDIRFGGGPAPFRHTLHIVLAGVKTVGAWATSIVHLASTSSMCLIRPYTLIRFQCKVPTKSMEQGPSSAANSLSASQESPWILQSPRAHYRIRVLPPLIHVFSQINPVNDLPPCFLKVHSNTLFQSTTGSSKWFISLRFPYQNIVFTPPNPILVTCPAHFMPPLCSSRLCNCLQYPVISTPRPPPKINISPSVFYSRKPSTYVLPLRETVLDPYDNRQNCSTVYFILLDSEIEDMTYWMELWLTSLEFHLLLN